MFDFVKRWRTDGTHRLLLNSALSRIQQLEHDRLDLRFKFRDAEAKLREQERELIELRRQNRELRNDLLATVPGGVNDMTNDFFVPQ